MSGIPIYVNVQLPKGLNPKDYDRKVVMSGITKAARGVQKLSKSLLNKRGAPSQPNEYPKRVSGNMWRHVKVHKSTRKDRLWARVEIDSFKDKSVWYPAVLFYGSDKRNIKPRLDAVWDAQAKLEKESASLIEEALQKGLKGWF